MYVFPRYKPLTSGGDKAESFKCWHHFIVTGTNSGALRNDYCSENVEAVLITLDLDYDLDIW